VVRCTSKALRPPEAERTSSDAGKGNGTLDGSCGRCLMIASLLPPQVPVRLSTVLALSSGIMWHRKCIGLACLVQANYIHFSVPLFSLPYELKEALNGDQYSVRQSVCFFYKKDYLARRQKRPPVKIIAKSMQQRSQIVLFLYTKIPSWCPSEGGCFRSFSRLLKKLE
jgi:hypothetical protein